MPSPSALLPGSPPPARRKTALSCEVLVQHCWRGQPGGDDCGVWIALLSVGLPFSIPPLPGLDLPPSAIMSNDPLSQLRQGYIDLHRCTTITIRTQSGQREELDRARNDVLRFMDDAAMVCPLV